MLFPCISIKQTVSVWESRLQRHTFWHAIGSWFATRCDLISFRGEIQVFDDIGTQVLDALFNGYNACVLAYGQSGTGKTYTMIGTEVNTRQDWLELVNLSIKCEVF